ncbi:MAG: methyl-accepting chemotaxis protein [Clostridium sp.]|jgi:methyl-accepting chemotaxis protein
MRKVEKYRKIKIVVSRVIIEEMVVLFNSLRKKVTAGFMSVAIISMLTMFVLIAVNMGSILNEQTKSDVTIIAAQVGMSLEKSSNMTVDAQSYIEELCKEQPSITNFQIIDLNGNIVANSDNSQIGKPGNAKAVEAIKSGLTMDYIDSQYNGITTAVPQLTDGKITGVVSITIATQDLQYIAIKILQKIGLLFITSLILILIFAYYFSSKITKPIKNVVSALETISEGDFTATLEVSSKDEVGTLAIAMNKTLEILREMIGSIKNTTNSLNGVSQTLSASSEEVASSSMEITKSVGEVADGAMKQSENLIESVALLEEFAKTFDTINENVQLVSVGSSKIKGAADVGSLRIEELVTSVEGIRNGFKFVVEKLILLNASVEKITAITEVINDVAGQTNLLALNASIEAARAGESGKGFAVVADEIRKLAEQVSSSSNGIMDLVSTVTKDTKDVSSTAGLVSNKIEEQVVTVESTVASFKDILDEVFLIVPQIINVNNALESAVKSKDYVVEKVESVASVSEEVAASAEEISAATQEQAASSEEMTATAESLAGMAESLSASVEKFKI